MTTKSITEWADRKINEETDNDIFFALSTARTKNEVIELLSGNIVWDYNDGEIKSLILSYYNEYLKINLSSWLSIEKELLEYFNMLEYKNGIHSIDDFYIPYLMIGI